MYPFLKNASFWVHSEPFICSLTEVAPIICAKVMGCRIKVDKNQSIQWQNQWHDDFMLYEWRQITTCTPHRTIDSKCHGSLYSLYVDIFWNADQIKAIVVQLIMTVKFFQMYLCIAKHLSCLELALVSSSTIITNTKTQTQTHTHMSYK